MKENGLLAIVMGRNYTSRLGMIRAAGVAGCKIVTIQTNRTSKGIEKIDASSNYVIKAITSIEPDQNDLISKILQFRNPAQKTILLPTDDYTASTIDLHFDLLKEDFLMPHVLHTQGGIVRLMDKDFQKHLAKESGLLVAEGAKSKYENGRYQIPSNILYPCFVKPNESYKRPLKQFMKKCTNEVELINQLQSISQVTHEDMLIEQFIDIDREYAVLGLSIGTESIIPNIVTMKSGYLGVTAIGEISGIESVKGLNAMLKQFMKNTNLTGLFDIDLYESKGQVYFNELNLRLGASGYAVTSSSINLVELLIKYLLDGSFQINEPPREYKPLTFANEKTCLAKYAHNQWNFKEYKNAIGNVDISFIKNAKDIRPYAYFKKEVVKCRVRKCFKGSGS